VLKNVFIPETFTGKWKYSEIGPWKVECRIFVWIETKKPWMDLFGRSNDQEVYTDQEGGKL